MLGVLLKSTLIYNYVSKIIAIFVQIHKIMLFDELDLEYEILDGLEAMNFSEATPVQEATIPMLLQGRDMIACAQTGTGKTAAYLLPILNKISRGEVVPDKVSAIIMAPTRELAIQIEQQITGFAYFLPISAVAIYGGTNGIAFEQQKRGLTLGADIVIATPGRLISMLNLQEADLNSVSYFVLDEADRMLDMGFMDDIMQIYSLLPKECQTVMFSATMPPKIRQLAKTILKNPAEVTIAISRPPESIQQSAYVCYERQKFPLIKSLFEATPPERCIVFCSSKLKVKELTKAIGRSGIHVAAMHSDLAQNEREQVMRDFKNGHIKLLIATDIVARGIDVDNISMVINYDIPHDPEDYVHRIGRTARGNNDHGIAITFVSEIEQARFGHIEDFLGNPVPKATLPEKLGQAPRYAPKDPPEDSNIRSKNRSSKSNGYSNKIRRDLSKKHNGRSEKSAHYSSTVDSVARPYRGSSNRPSEEQSTERTHYVRRRKPLRKHKQSEGAE